MGKRLKLGEMLVAKRLISEADLASALEEQRRWGKRLGMTLVLMGVLEEETLIRTLAAQLKLPVARIRGKRVNAEVIELVPVELAEKHRCLPLFVKEQGGSKELFLAMEDPSDLDAQGELGFRIGFRIRPVLVAPTELEDALQRHYHWSALMGSPGPGAEPEPARPRAAASPPALKPALEKKPAQESPFEPFEDTAPELVAGAAAPAEPAADADPAVDESAGDTQPDPPDLDQAAEELGAFGDPESGRPAQRAQAHREKPASPRAAAPAMSPDVILRALTQLLVEKGLLSRDELVERLRALAAKEGAERGQS
jgi:type IV pilus assembly protein PilB